MSSVMQIAMREMGQLIELANANQKYLPGPIFNVGGFGAVADGTTDSTEIVQAVIDEAVANGQRTIFFPHGTSGQYFVTSLTNADQVDFIGDNCSFVGGYSGTIENMGGLAELKAETVTGVFNAVTGYEADNSGTNATHTQIQNAINACRDAGGGDVYLPPGTYKIGAGLTMFSNVRLLGSNATILVDFEGDYAVLGTGTIGASLTVSDDITAGTKIVTGIDSTASLTVGDWLKIQTNIDSQRYPVVFRQIESVDSASQITVKEPINIAYTAVGVTYLQKVTFIENSSVEGLTFDCLESANVKAIIFYQYGKDISIINNEVNNHRYATNPSAMLSISAYYSYDVLLERNRKYGIEDLSYDAGDSITIYACEKARMISNVVVGGAFCMSAWLSLNPIISLNQIQGMDGIRSTRGYKIAGCIDAELVTNTVENTDSGIKNEDSERTKIIGNTIRNCGNDNDGSHGINCSNQITKVRRGHQIIGNDVINQTGFGIHMDGNCSRYMVSHNIIKSPSNGGIISDGDYAQIIGNRVEDAAGSFGIRFTPRETIVSGNQIESTDGTKKCFKLNNVTYPGDCVFVNNIAPSQAVDTTYNFMLLGVVIGNRIGGSFQNKEVKKAMLPIANFGAGQSVTGASWTAYAWGTFIGKASFPSNATYTLRVVVGTTSGTGYIRAVINSKDTGQVTVTTSGKNRLNAVMDLSTVAANDLDLQAYVSGGGTLTIYEAWIEVSW